MQQIAQENLTTGSKLPTERELVQRSGQSRSAVRRALATLESQGRVVRHVGRGTFIGPPARSGSSEISPAESMAARLLIEPSILPAIVTAARRDDFVEMERCVVGGERAESFEEFENWDAAFHRSLALATHNDLLVRISELINDARLEPEWGQLKRKSLTAERRLQYITDHRNIVAALVNRDVEGAQGAMRDHLIRVRSNLLGAAV
jgi:DNA-binding FadR family transcriptional regulator